MSTLSVGSQRSDVPKQLEQRLSQLIRRARLVMLVKGLLAVVSMAVLLLLLGMAVDASVTIFTIAPRVLLSGCLLAGLLASIYLFLVRPLQRSFSLTGIARMIELRHPELEERLSSAVELLTTSDATELKGSAVLIAELANQASGQALTVDPRREFSFRAARRVFTIMLVLSGVLTVTMMLWPQQAMRLVNRLVVPFANADNMRAVDMVVTPGNTTVPLGDSLRIGLAVPDLRVQKSRLLIVGTDGVETSIPMQAIDKDRQGRPSFTITIPTVEEEFRYRIYAGGALTRYYQVVVVPRPAVQQLIVHYDYPEYTLKPDFTDNDSSGDIVGPLGTEVTVIADVNTGLQKAVLLVDDHPVAVGKSVGGESGRAYSWTFSLTEQMIAGRRWSLELVDQHRFKNWGQKYYIKAQRDRSPTVRVVKPTGRQLRMKRNDLLPIGYLVDDDYGVARADVLTVIDDAETAASPITLRGIVIGKQSGQTVLNLGRMELSAASKLTVQLRVQDNLPENLDGPQQGLSHVITIVLDESAESYFEMRAAEDYEGIRKELTEILEQLQEVQQQTGSWEEKVAVRGVLPEDLLTIIDDVRVQDADVEQRLRNLGDVLPVTSFAALAPEVVDLADTDVTLAREYAGQIKLADRPQKRAEHGKTSDQHVLVAIERTEKLIEELDELWKKIQRIADLRDLASQEEQIADLLEELAQDTQTPQMPNELFEEQSQLNQEIAETIEQSAQTLEELFEQQLEKAQQLAQTAEELAAQQEQLAQLTEELQQEEPGDLLEQLTEQILAEQQEIAEEAAALDERIQQADDLAEPEDEPIQLADKPEETLADLQEGDLEEAAEDAQQAADQLEEAAQQIEMGEEPSQDPDAEDMAADSEPGDDPEGTPEPGDDPEGTPEPGDDPEGTPEPGDDPEGTPEPGDDPEGTPEPGDDPEGMPEPGDDPEGMPEPGDDPEGMPEPGDDPEGMPEAGEPMLENELAQQAQDLADRQEAVAEQLEALNEGNIEEAIELLQEQLAGMAEELAEDVANLDQQVQAMNQAEAAQQAVAEASDQSAEAADQAEEAQEQLAQLTPEPMPAEGASPEPGDNPEGTPEAGDEPAGTPEPGSEPSEGSPTPPDSPMPLGEAEMQQALEEAQGLQEEAATQLQNTAESLQQFGEQVEAQLADLGRTPEGTPQPAETDPLLEAFEQAAEAAAELAEAGDPMPMPVDAAAAAAAADAAAEALAEAALQAALEAGVPSDTVAPSNAPPSNQLSDQPGQPSQNPATPAQRAAAGQGEQGRRGGTMDNETEQLLRKYKLSRSDWLRLPGRLKNQIMQAEARGVPEEYRELVRRYFSELARKGTSTQGGNGNGSK